MVTLRVYDSASIRKEYADYIDRYSLYVPTPRNKIKEWGIMGIFLGFSFTEKGITKCSWDECRHGVGTMNLGKKVKRESLPQHVQQWIDTMEEKYNRALKEDSKEAWVDSFIEAVNTY